MQLLNSLFFLQLDIYDGKAVGEGMLLDIIQISYRCTRYGPFNTHFVDDWTRGGDPDC